MRIVAVIQARLGSSRLPGKILADIGGKPMLAHVLERAQAITGVTDVVLAIPRGDLEISNYVCAPHVELGSPIDVLDRVVRSAQRLEADAVVRLTGDCPLLAADFSGEVIRRFLEEKPDYASNVNPLADGLDTEVISFGALSAAWWEASDPYELEHVTHFIRHRPERFDILDVRLPDWWPGIKLSVDTAADLACVRAIHRHLRPGEFSMKTTLNAWEEAGRP